jgi:hypothetical protein
MRRKDRLERKKYPIILNVTLTASQDRFLQDVGNLSRGEKGEGHKLAKTEILRGLCEALKELVDSKEIDLSEVRDSKDFADRLRKAFGIK